MSMCINWAKISPEWVSLVIAFIALVFTIVEYIKYKKRFRVEILCKFNERYQKDNEIKCVTEFLEKLEDGKSDKIPDVHELEMYMRFYEELYFLIKSGAMRMGVAYYMFGHYVMIFDDNKRELPKDLHYDAEYWEIFRSMVDELRNFEKQHRRNYKI